MKRRPLKRSRPVALSPKSLLVSLAASERQVWEAAQSVHRNMDRLVDVTRVLERHGVQARAQMVLDRLVPDVEELVRLLELRRPRTSDEQILETVRRIADRLGLD